MKILALTFQGVGLVIGTVAAALGEWGIASTMWAMAIFWAVKEQQYDQSHNL